MDNIYVLNYIVNRQIEKKGGKLVALFVDLKAAIDSLDRGVLLQAMRGRGVRENLVERVGEILKETRSRVRVGGEMGENFWTARGMRHGCPLSPILFNLLIADLEEMESQVGRGKDRREKSILTGICGRHSIVSKRRGDEKYDRETGEVFRKEKTGTECR